LTTEEIELAVAKHFNVRRNIIVPNISWGLGLHECDVLVLRPSGYLLEVEIKRTKADLINDANKLHGHIDRKNRIKEFWFAIPEELIETAKENLDKKIGIIAVYKTQWGAQPITVRDATPNKNPKKLTQKERLQMIRLGCIRIWSLKKKIKTLQDRNSKK
jgi:hypothetical protein